MNKMASTPKPLRKEMKKEKSAGSKFLKKTYPDMSKNEVRKRVSKNVKHQKSLGLFK